MCARRPIYASKSKFASSTSSYSETEKYVAKAIGKSGWHLHFAVLSVIFSVLALQLRCVPSSSPIVEASARIDNSSGVGRNNREGKSRVKKVKQEVFRGQKVSERVNAEELHNAYEEIRDDYDRVAFHPSSAKKWSIIKSTKDDIEISILEHENERECPYVRMVANVTGSKEDVWDFLELDNWEQYMPKMDPLYDGVSIEGTYEHRGVKMILARKKTTKLVGGLFGPRDFTFLSVSDLPRSDGTWVSGTVSVVTDKLPRETGYTRAYQDSVAFYQNIDPDEESGLPRSRLTIITRIDLNDSSEDGEGGAIPMWLYVKTVGTTAAIALRNMRREVDIILKKRLTLETEKKKSKIPRWLQTKLGRPT